MSATLASVERRARVMLAIGCVLGGTSSAHALSAGDVRERLRVEPGTTCLTAARLALEVEPLLEDVRLPGDLLFVVKGSDFDSRDVRLRVVRDHRTVAERAFEPGPDRCDRLHAAVGLAIALAINAAHEPERDSARAWSASLVGLWAYRVMPQFAPGVELLARRELGDHLRLRAGVLTVAAFDTALPARAGTFDAALVVGRADACARTRLEPALHASTCAGMFGGVLYGVGDDVSGATSSAVPWLALAAAADLEFVLSARWALALGLSASVLLHRVEVGIEDLDGTRVHRHALDRVAFAIGLGPVCYF